MSPARAQDLAALCRASRGVVLDRAELVRAFVRGVLARGPVDPEALLVVLDHAGVSETAWCAAGAATSVPVVSKQALRTAYLKRHAVQELPRCR